MLGFSPLSSAPFSSLSGKRHAVAISESANASDQELSQLDPGGELAETVTGTDVSTQIKSSVAQHSEATSGVYYDFLNSLAPNAFNSIAWDSNQGVGVSFQAKDSGPIGSVSFKLASVGSGAFPSDYTIELYSASSRTGVIGSLLASKTFSLASITTSATYEFSFQGVPGASVTAGQWYLIGIKSPTNSTINGRYLFAQCNAGAPGFEQYSNEQVGQSGAYTLDGVWGFDVGLAQLKVAVYGTDTTLESQLGGYSTSADLAETGTSNESVNRTITTTKYINQPTTDNFVNSYLFGDQTSGSGTGTITADSVGGVRFTASKSGNLGRVTVRMQNSSGNTSTTPATIRLEVNGGAVLGTIPFLPTSIPGGNYANITFDFSSIPGAIITSGTTYNIVLQGGADWGSANLTLNFVSTTTSPVTASLMQANCTFFTGNTVNSGINTRAFFFKVEEAIQEEASVTQLSTTQEIAETGTLTELSDRLLTALGFRNEFSNSEPLLDTFYGYSKSSASVNGGTVEAFSQPFVANQTTKLGLVTFNARRFNTAASLPTQPFTIEVWQGVVSSAPQTLLTSTSMSLAGISSDVGGAPYSVDFSAANITLTSGQTYAIVFREGSDWDGGTQYLMLSSAARFASVATAWNYQTNFVSPANRLTFGFWGGSDEILSLAIYPSYQAESSVSALDAQVDASETGTANESETNVVSFLSDITETGTADETENRLVTALRTLTESGTASESSLGLTYDVTPQSVLYWVGGSGTLSSTNGGKWALTSGGAPTLFAPSAITDVYFDSNSDAGAPFTVSIGTTTCKSITISALDQQLTMTGTGTLTVNGSVSLPTTNFNSTYTGNIVYQGGGRQSINYNNNTFGNNTTIGSSSVNYAGENETVLQLGSYFGTSVHNIADYVYYTGSGIAVYSNDNSTWSSDSVISTFMSHTVNTPTHSLIFGALSNSYLVYTLGDPTFNVTSVSTNVPAFSSAGGSDSAYGNGTLVAVGGVQIFTATSVFGPWTSRTSNSGGNALYGVCWTGTQFIAVGNSGTVITSPDGITWTSRTSTSSTTAALFGGVFSDGTNHVAFGNGGVIIRSTDGINWTTQTSNTTSNLTGAYGNGYFVAVSGSVARYSTDGVTWSNGTGLGNADRITFVSGKFWTAGNGNAAYYSTDGALWTFTNKGNAGGLTMAYSPTLDTYVTVGNAGIIQRSFKIATISGASSRIPLRTTAIGLTAVDLKQVIWGNDKFVAVGNSGTVLTSSNGIDWVAQSSGVAAILYSVCWTGTQFIAVGNSGTVLTSSNAVTWTPRTSGTTNVFNKIKSNGTINVAVGVSSVYSSTDGINWTSRYTTTSTLNDLIWVADLNLWVTVGTNALLLTSSDGITWTPRTATGLSGSISAVAYGDGVLMAYASALKSFSYDAINWQLRSNDVYSVASASFIPEKQVMVVTETPGTLKTAYYDTPNYVITSSMQAAGTLSITRGGLILQSPVTVGAFSLPTGTNPRAFNLIDQNISVNGTGTVWDIQATDSVHQFLITNSTIILSNDSTATRRFNNTNIGTSIITPRTYNNIVIGGSSTCTTEFVANGIITINSLSSTKTVPHTVGFGTNDTFRINIWDIEGSPGNYVSLRKVGTTNSRRNRYVPANSFPLNDVFWCDTEFLAVGSTGAMSTSIDGINWTARTSGTTTNLTGVVRAAGITVVIGATGLIRTSPDNKTWTTQTSGTANNLTDICWTGTHFLVVGNTGTILTSPDAINWTTQTNANLTTNLNRCGTSGSYHLIGGSGLLYGGSDITDIANWTTTGYTPTALVTEIAYGNGYFVVFQANSSNNNAAYSTNGTSWTGFSTASAGPSCSRLVYNTALQQWLGTTNGYGGMYTSTPGFATPASIVYSSTVNISSAATSAVAFGKKQSVLLASGPVVVLQNANYQLIEY